MEHELEIIEFWTILNIVKNYSEEKIAALVSLRRRTEKKLEPVPEPRSPSLEWKSYIISTATFDVDPRPIPIASARVNRFGGG